MYIDFKAMFILNEHLKYFGHDRLNMISENFINGG